MQHEHRSIHVGEPEKREPLTPVQEMHLAAYALAMIVDQLVEWNALALAQDRGGPVSEAWFNDLKLARDKFRFARSECELAGAPASRTLS